MLWMKAPRRKSWYAHYKETLANLVKLREHAKNLEAQNSLLSEGIVHLKMRYKEQLEIARSEHTKSILQMRLFHEERVKDVKAELKALQIEVEQVKVKDEIAETTDGLIARCVTVLVDYARGVAPGPFESAKIGEAVNEFMEKQQREAGLQAQKAKLAEERRIAAMTNRVYFSELRRDPSATFPPSMGGEPAYLSELGAVHINEIPKGLSPRPTEEEPKAKAT